jgi:hypothetical protein
MGQLTMRHIQRIINIHCLLVLVAIPVAAQIKPSTANLSPSKLSEMSVSPLVPIPVFAPEKEITISNEAFSTNRTRPVAANGYLIATARMITPNRQDGVALTPLRTGQTQIFPFFLDGAELIRVESSTVTKDGNIILVGSHEASNFIAVLDISGNLKHVEDTQTYTPMRVCSAPDGSIWTFGQDTAAEATKVDYAMLQHRTASGKLLDQFLAHSSLHAEMPLNFHDQAPNSNFAAIACGNRSVAVYAGTGTEAYVWSEIDMPTRTFYQTIVPRIHDTRMTGLSLTGPNVAYMSTPTGLYRLFTIVVPANNNQHVSWWMHAGNGEDDALKVAGTVLGSDGGMMMHVKNGLPSEKTGVGQANGNAIRLCWTRIP